MADYSSIPDEAARRLNIYVARVRRWSSHINLTGAATEDEIFDTLVRPVLGAQDLIRNPLIDVGSGNGSPGLVLAAHRAGVTNILLRKFHDTLLGYGPAPLAMIRQAMLGK